MKLEWFLEKLIEDGVLGNDAHVKNFLLEGKFEKDPIAYFNNEIYSFKDRASLCGNWSHYKDPNKERNYLEIATHGAA